MKLNAECEELIDRARKVGPLDEALPKLAKDPGFIAAVSAAVRRLATEHDLRLGDARNLGHLPDGSVHLVVTSPPYWSLKRYNEHDDQMGHIEEYEEFLDELDQVWAECFRVLVPGGRVICVVGDVCLSRKKNNGRHTVVPLHASIQERCRLLGYDNLAPIIWHKIANANYEAEGSGAGFLGKPFEPNAVVKNDIEFVLMQRKPGGYRSPSPEVRVLSLLGALEHRSWFRQIWSDVPGASTRQHPAPYPEELAMRLVRMFSFVGDVVLDPFMGTATTNVAAGQVGRNSRGVEIDPKYFEMARRRVTEAAGDLYLTRQIAAHG